MPKKDTQFKPGQSGNPGGLSKSKEELRRIFEKVALEDLEKKGEVRSRFEWVVRSVFEDAIKGKPTPQKEVLDKCLGKNYRVSLVSKDGIKVIIEHVDGKKGADDSA